MPFTQDIGVDCYLTSHEGEVIALDPSHTYLFGRDEQADIQVTDALSSREHCRMRWDLSGTWLIEDLGSRNGTFVDGERITTPVALGDRTMFQVGGRRFTLHLLPPGSDPEDLAKHQHMVGAMETFEMAPSDGGMAKPEPLRGQLDGLEDILRFFMLTKKSGRLVIDSDDTSQIWFDAGRPVHAVHRDVTGMDALVQLVAISGRFELHEGDLFDQEPSITARIQDILAELYPSDPLANREHAYDIEKATNLQRHLLERLPKIPGYDIGVMFRGLSGVSGDFYDVSVMADGRVIIVLGDVSGHGIQAAMVGTNTLKALRLLRQTHSDLGELLRMLNVEVHEDLLPGQFITLFAAVLHPSSGQLTVALAGHHPALLVDRQGDAPVREVGASGMALGLMGDQQFSAKLDLVTVDLPVGSVLLQCTDGMFECTDAEGQEFGWERLTATLADQRRAPDMKNLTSTLADVVSAHAHQIDDDITVFAIARTDQVDANLAPAASSDRMRIESGPHKRPREQTDEAPAPSATATLVASGGDNADGTRQQPAPEERAAAGVFGPAQALELIGRGSTGTTYLGEHSNLGMQVAIKVLDLPKEDVEAWRSSFLAEARRAIQVHHPNVVQVLDAGATAAGRYYQVVELIRGGTLADRLTRVGQLSTNDLLDLVPSLCAGLAAIHEAGMLHRDLKPSNILIDDRGRPRISDLGLASVIQDTAAKRVTSKRILIGSPNYMAPEVVDPNAQEGPAADIYSLGATMYHLASGSPPCSGRSTVEVLRAQVRGDIQPLGQRMPDLDPALAMLVDRCLARDQHQRPTADELVAWFRTREPEIKTDRLPALTPTRTPSHGPHPPSIDHNLRWIVGGGIVIGCLIGLIVWLLLQP